ncbi:cation diffusion facilitator family transporter [Sphingomonas crocodyli]|uniref:Cation diffusion facilitator family transporter n=1 Tax=Sphingomonas crocodyli TaxID=1979270 RepID=A0A437M960_9SPHN|nr:cation diffusion facilitator family transporter [Sphingomonas crocodyli]RVT94232.1 cation diffusion facilitator family transporter [Sphingomonas crocodyli]
MVLLGMGTDLAIALLKFTAASATASASMFAEGMHSVMDLATEAILLYGLYAARRPANVEHQLGFGREIFFWNFIAALVLLALGAGVTLHNALRQVIHPRPLEDGWINYAVLATSFAVEAVITCYAIRSSRLMRLRHGIRRYLMEVRDVTSLTVLATSLAGLLGLAIATIGTVSGAAFHRPVLDGLASILIAVLMGLTALLLAGQSKSLLIGAAATEDTVADIKRAATGLEEVRSINGCLTVHLAAEQLLVGLSVSFSPGLDTAEVEAAVIKLEQAVKSCRPDVRFLFVRPESVETADRRRRLRGW